MTFHPTVRDRFIHLLILFVCAGLVAASAFFFVWSASPNAGQFGQTLAVTSALLLVSLYINWMAWSANVRVHDRGVDWTEGRNSGSLTWECIAGFSWKVERKNLRVGLVEKSAGELRILPFLSAPLYAALRERDACPPTSRRRWAFGSERRELFPLIDPDSAFRLHCLNRTSPSTRWRTQAA